MYCGVPFLSSLEQEDIKIAADIASAARFAGSKFFTVPKYLDSGNFLQDGIPFNSRAKEERFPIKYRSNPEIHRSKTEKAEVNKVNILKVNDLKGIIPGQRRCF